MAERTAVQCRACGQPYSARVVGKRYVLATHDGNCACGSDEFAEVSGVVRTPEERTR